MKLFLKIVLAIITLIALLIFGFWLSAKLAARPGPEAGPLASLTAEDFQTALEGIAAERKLVGMAGKVMVDGEIIAEAATGWRTKDEEAPLSADDLFHVGSIGKSMSATAVATLVEDGVMNWDDRLGERLSSVPMDAGWEDVTLHQLLTHTASAPNIPLTAMINSVSEPVRLREVRRETAATMLTDPPATPPGSRFAYSNAGFMLASLMAEEATGESWETIMRERVAAPLGMDSLDFGAPLGNAPWGHKRLGAIKLAADPNEGGADNPPWMAAAGTMHMRLDDLLLYAQAHLDAGEREDSLLSSDTFSRLHTPVMGDYAYGWIVQRRDFGNGEEPVIWHNGSNTMWYALLVLLPERNAAIVLATNDGSQTALTQRRFDSFAMEIAEAIVARG